MKSEEILKLAEKNIKDSKFSDWRWGQMIFNIAYELYPNETDKLRASKVDCFYRDNLVEKFLKDIDKL